MPVHWIDSFTCLCLCRVLMLMLCWCWSVWWYAVLCCALSPVCMYDTQRDRAPHRTAQHSTAHTAQQHCRVTAGLLLCWDDDAIDNNAHSHSHSHSYFIPAHHSALYPFEELPPRIHCFGIRHVRMSIPYGKLFLFFVFCFLFTGDRFILTVYLYRFQKIWKFSFLILFNCMRVE
jgi:hypothetical protein